MSDQQKHTPGPWTNKYVVAGEIVTGNQGGDTMVIKALRPPDRAQTILIACCSKGTGDRHANARLIAAAPALLEACKAFVDIVDKDLDCGCEHSFAHTVDIAEAAIAKAEKGET